MSSKYFKIIFFFPVIVLTVIAFTNCSRYGALNVTGGASLTSPPVSEPVPGGGAGAGEDEQVSSEKLGMPYALLSAEQTMFSMLRVTGVNNCPGLDNEYKRRYSSLAAGNDIAMVNGPLLMGSTSLAGEICYCLYEEERARPDGSRFFYNGLNFNTTVDALPEAVFLNSIRGMARSFWARNETAEELEAFKQFRIEYRQYVAASELSDPGITKDVLGSTCAAMLSSIDTLTY